MHGDAITRPLPHGHLNSGRARALASCAAGISKQDWTTMAAIALPRGFFRQFIDDTATVTDGEMLPERVRRALRDEQDRAERLIGWFQLGVVLFFLTLYLIAPKPADRPMQFQPVPWVLGLYLLATVIRLVWSRFMRLPAWSLAISIFIDMGLLIGLIWSFHIQYEQSPAFYLKAPTILSVFIFIALRALRFEAGYVLLAGGVAALGWIGLVAYAAAFDPTGMPITRDFVRYMTSNAILLGAEIEKVVTILLVSGLLAWSLRRARRTLVSAVAESSAARELKRFFAADVAQAITQSDEAIRPGQGVCREAATMFTDLRGFTVMSRTLSPDETVGLLAEYQARLVPIIQRNGGSIDKFLGDGIMASFGAARASKTYAADALRAVDEIIIETRRWASMREADGLPTVRVGAAVAVGPLIFGAVGDETRLEYTVIGDPVNLAAKLEKHTKVEKVDALTTRESLELARAQGYVPEQPKRLLAQRQVGGVDVPVDLAVLA
jgi:adenylate cyclase